MVVLLTSTLAFALTIWLPLVREWLLEPRDKQTKTTAEQRTTAAKMILACVLRSPLSNECAIAQNPINARATKAAALSGTHSKAKAIILRLSFSMEKPFLEIQQP